MSLQIKVFVVVFQCAVLPSVSPAADQETTPMLQVGNDLTLSANITSINRQITSITWSHLGNILTNGVDGVTITNNNPLYSPPVVSTLQRSSLALQDFGEYVVTATNQVGDATFTFDVVVPGTFLS